MQHTRSGACKQGQLCTGMAISTTPAVCPGRGHNTGFGPPEPPGPLRMPSGMKGAGAAGIGRQSEAGTNLKREGATRVMKRQRRARVGEQAGMRRMRGEQRGRAGERGKGKGRDTPGKHSRRARQRPRRVNARAVPAPFSPGTGPRPRSRRVGPAAVWAPPRPLTCPGPPALARCGPRAAAASRAQRRPAPPRSAPLPAPRRLLPPPPSRLRHRYPAVCPCPGRHGPAPQRRACIGAVGPVPGSPPPW